MAVHPGLGLGSRSALVSNIVIDRLTAEVTGALTDAGIEHLLMKGPVIARWLYPDVVRPYWDSDILVARRDWEQSVAVLQDLGFSAYRGFGHPGLESTTSAAFIRGAGHENVDLHRTLEGLTADPDEVWRILTADATRDFIGGREVGIPARAVVLMHIALHAAHHGRQPKVVEDVRRALLHADEDLWRQAADRAMALGGLAAFSSGLRLLPEGAALAERLGIRDVRSVTFDLRVRGTPTAEALHHLLDPERPARERCAFLLRELFPSPEFIRWWTPLARRSRRGLIAGYAWRWAWLGANVPRGLMAVRRARRARG